MDAVAQDVFGVAQYPPVELAEAPVALQLVIAAGQGLVGDVPIVPVAETMLKVGPPYGAWYQAERFFLIVVPSLGVAAECQLGQLIVPLSGRCARRDIGDISRPLNTHGMYSP